MKTTPFSKFLQGYSELLALLTKDRLVNQPVFIVLEVLITKLAQRAQLAQLKGRRNWLNGLNWHNRLNLKKVQPFSPAAAI